MAQAHCMLDNQGHKHKLIIFIRHRVPTATIVTRTRHNITLSAHGLSCYINLFLCQLKRCAASRTIPGSIPGRVTGFFSDIFPSDSTMALGSTQPLVKMSTRDVPGGKGGLCERLTTYHHIVPISRNLGTLTLLDPSGPAWPVMGVLYLYLSVN
jgi:hypothetical protein